MWGTHCLWLTRLDDELDGADTVEGCDGAAGDDGERGRERGDGDESEIGAAFDEFDGTLRGLGGVDEVAGGEGGGERGVVEVPHEARG